MHSILEHLEKLFKDTPGRRVQRIDNDNALLVSDEVYGPEEKFTAHIVKPRSVLFARRATPSMQDASDNVARQAMEQVLKTTTEETVIPLFNDDDKSMGVGVKFDWTRDSAQLEGNVEDKIVELRTYGSKHGGGLRRFFGRLGLPWDE